jgi:uncharacterized protein
MSSVVHFEFSVPNPEEAAAFYSAVFGWSITKLPDPIRYWQILTAEAPAQRAISGGIVQSKTGSPRVSVTIQVSSLSEACTRVTARGGSLITEPQTIPGYGVHVLCRDPQGNFFALLEPISAG